MWFLRRRGSSKSEEATKALEEAKKALEKVQKRSEIVSTIANESKDIREQNHFAEQLEELFTNRRRPLHP